MYFTMIAKWFICVHFVLQHNSTVYSLMKLILSLMITPRTHTHTHTHTHTYAHFLRSCFWHKIARFLSFAKVYLLPKALRTRWCYWSKYRTESQKKLKSCCYRKFGSEDRVALETLAQTPVLLQKLRIRSLYCYRHSGLEPCIATETLDQRAVLLQKLWIKALYWDRKSGMQAPRCYKKSGTEGNYWRPSI